VSFDILIVQQQCRTEK